MRFGYASCYSLMSVTRQPNPPENGIDLIHWVPCLGWPNNIVISPRPSRECGCQKYGVHFQRQCFSWGGSDADLMVNECIDHPPCSPFFAPYFGRLRIECEWNQLKSRIDSIGCGLRCPLASCAFVDRASITSKHVPGRQKTLLLVLLWPTVSPDGRRLKTRVHNRLVHNSISSHP